MRQLFTAITLCVVALTPAFAQFELGSIVGVVTDPAKAPIAGATVEIRSVSTNVKREVQTSNGGEFNSLPLQPGSYRITVHQPGFRDLIMDVTLGVSQR